MKIEYQIVEPSSVDDHAQRRMRRAHILSGHDRLGRCGNLTRQRHGHGITGLGRVPRRILRVDAKDIRLTGLQAFDRVTRLGLADGRRRTGSSDEVVETARVVRGWSPRQRHAVLGGRRDNEVGRRRGRRAIARLGRKQGRTAQRP